MFSVPLMGWPVSVRRRKDQAPSTAAHPPHPISTGPGRTERKAACIFTQCHVEAHSCQGGEPEGGIDRHASSLLIHPRRDGAHIREGEQRQPHHLTEPAHQTPLHPSVQTIKASGVADCRPARDLPPLLEFWKARCLDRIGGWLLAGPADSGPQNAERTPSGPAWTPTAGPCSRPGSGGPRGCTAPQPQSSCKHTRMGRKDRPSHPLHV